MKKPNPNEIYRHFKGDLYRVITLAVHSETQEEMVVYQGLYGSFPVYVRPLAMFMEPVDREKYPDAGQALRFELAEELVGQGSAEPQGNAAAQGNATAQDEKEKSQGGVTKLQQPAVSQEDVLPQESQAEKRQEEPAAEPQKDPAEDQELPLDPLVLEFLDADSYEERLNILVALHPRITDDMINTLAMVIDVEVKEGEIEERYAELKFCLLTKEKYERTRLT